ncbi:MAG: DUF4258 domain-containing protein [Deltaproteobacteria bacterium]|nr:DUF4258 domain-containing protein [Deltaproteobacteria bacterium]
MDREKIAELVREGKYRLTLHAQQRMDQRAITLEELKEVIYHGEVIEEYPHDKPFPSCLMMGRIRGGFPLYIVLSLESWVHIITVHWMDPEKWLDPQTRREKK